MHILFAVVFLVVCFVWGIAKARSERRGQARAYGKYIRDNPAHGFTSGPANKP